MTTKSEIREQVRGWAGSVSYDAGRNQTNYPVRWSKWASSGGLAPAATTHRAGDCRMDLVIERAEKYYGVTVPHRQREYITTRSQVVDAIHAALATVAAV